MKVKNIFFVVVGFLVLGSKISFAKVNSAFNKNHSVSIESGTKMVATTSGTTGGGE